MTFPTLFKITPEPFAMDLSDRSVKIIKLGRKRGELFLENFGSFSVEQGVMEEGAILDEKKLIAAIQKGLGALKNGPLQTSYVSCSLPEQKTYQRVVQLPLMKEEEMREAIQWEIEANIPVPLAEIYFDWQVIPSKNQKNGHADILVSAAAKDIVDSYTALFDKADLIPFSFEPESVAISRSLIKNGFSKEPLLIVDLGRNRTSFVIYGGQSLRFSSSVKLSGEIFTQSIMKVMRVGEEEAVRLKEEVGLNERENKSVYEAMIPPLTDFKEQIEKYIEFYAARSEHAHSGVSAVSKVLLCGGGTTIKGLDKYLALSLGIPVEIGNPWVNILKPPLRETPELPFVESVRYATALGLALAYV